MKKIFCIFYSLLFMGLAACNDDDTFSASPGNLLTMERDTVSFDTVFSRIPTAALSFWIHNNSGDGIRCTNIRQERGNQSGFRVNVDGVYLGMESGFKTTDVEIRKGDSIRVFVELTAPCNNTDGPQLRSDNLIFSLESGVQQKVNLRAWTWDADTVHTLRITSDTEISSLVRPLIVFDSIVVERGATLTIGQGSTVYFHDNAGIDVHGTLVCQGDAANNVTLRGYRLDNMFDYLPYDLLPGRWQGIRIHEDSYDNVLDFTDIHSAYDAIVCDSADMERQKLTLTNSIIHNCQGYGLYSVGNKLNITNCQITNTLRDCVAFFGGEVEMLHCTVAQFYPFDSRRGSALYFTNMFRAGVLPLKMLSVTNSIVTGYAEDVVMGVPSADSLDVAFNYFFDSNLLRTPKVDDEESFSGNLWETPDSVVNGAAHFVKIDTDLLRYDFHLDSLSSACGRANREKLYPTTRDGVIRNPQKANLGCY